MSKTKPRKTPRPAEPAKPELPPRNLYQPQLRRALDNRDTAIRDLNWLTDLRLAETYRRGAYTTRPDSTHVASYDQAVQGTAELTAVEQAADQRVYGRPQPDMVGQWLDEAFAKLAEVARDINGIRGRIELALNIKPDPPGRQSTVVDCINPFLPTHPALPRPRAGRCEPCYRFRLDHNGTDRGMIPETEVAG